MEEMQEKCLGALPRENEEVECQVMNIPARSVSSKHERKLLKPATCSTLRGQKLVALSLKRTGMRSAWIVSSASKKTCTELRTKDNALRFAEIGRNLIDIIPETLGSGTFGTIYYGKYNTNIPVAIKEYKRNDPYEVEREARVLSCLQRNDHYPNLAFLIGAVNKSKPFVLVTQFMGYRSTSGAKKRKKIY